MKTKSPFLGIFVTFGKHMAKFFGVDADEAMLIGRHDGNIVDMENYNHKLSPDFKKPEINTLMIYSDIVLPKIHVGHVLKSISIAIFDKDGDDFSKNSFSVLELVIRPLPIDV